MVKQTVVSVNGKKTAYLNKKITKVDKSKYVGYKNPPILNSSVVSVVNSNSVCRDSKRKNRRTQQIMAIQIKSANNNANAVVTFEQVQEGKRIIAFNLLPSRSQQEVAGGGISAKGDKRQKTVWTSTASSFMYGEYGAFVDSRILVSAHLWSGSKYIAPPLYGKDKSGNYTVLSGAEPTGLSGEMYGYYLAYIDSLIEELNEALNSLEEKITNPNSEAEDIETLQTEMETITEKISELQDQKLNVDYFFGLCQNVQVKFDIPGLSQETMMATWSALTRKQPKILKLSCTISYDVQDSLEVYIKIFAFVIESGNLVPSSRGQAITNEDSEALRELAEVHFKKCTASSKGVVAKANTTIKAMNVTALEGSAATRRKNKFRMEQKARKAQQELALEALEQNQALASQPTPEVNDLDSLDLDVEDFDNI